jgi:methionyl-tRNA formyltransferase
MRLIFMGTPEFAVPVLQRLVHDGHQIVAVFTQPDKPAGRGNRLQAPPVKLVSQGLGIPVFQPARIKTNDEVRQAFESLHPDACIVTAYGKILPEWLLKIPRLGCINVHSSLLPKYRGAAPINWAIANGETQTGVTIMQMDPGMDTGPMLGSKAVDIDEYETAVELSERLSDLGADLLSGKLRLVERGEIQPEPQDESLASYAPMLKREDGLIDWSMPAKRVSDRVRGFQPWPGCYTVFRGGRLIIWRARPVSIDSMHLADPHSEGTHTGGFSVKPGMIAFLEKTGIVIACAESSFLRVEEIQLEGKRKVSARDFANGARLGIGDSIRDETATP